MARRAKQGCPERQRCAPLSDCMQSPVGHRMDAQDWRESAVSPRRHAPSYDHGADLWLQNPYQHRSEIRLHPWGCSHVCHAWSFSMNVPFTCQATDGKMLRNVLQAVDAVVLMFRMSCRCIGKPAILQMTSNISTACLSCGRVKTSWGDWRR